MKKFDHPLDSVFGIEVDTDSFDIEQNYSMVEQPKETINPNEPAPDPKDEDDILVEQRIDEVFTAAMEAFQTQNAYLEIIEPRYAARSAEVAANYLNIALSAANSRAKVKTDRKRANQTFIPHGNGGKNTTNVIVANREEILKMITIDQDGKNI